MKFLDKCQEISIIYRTVSIGILFPINKLNPFRIPQRLEKSIKEHAKVWNKKEIKQCLFVEIS